MAVARTAVLLVALITCAWFGLGLVQVSDANRATAIITRAGPLDAHQAGRADSLLRGAQLLNPDAEVDVLRGRLALRRADLQRGRVILEAVVKREPQNLQAWVWLAAASNGDRQALRLALIRIAQLDPKASQGS